MYGELGLFINGEWQAARSGKTYPVTNPATEEPLGQAPSAAGATATAPMAVASPTKGSSGNGAPEPNAIFTPASLSGLSMRARGCSVAMTPLLAKRGNTIPAVLKCIFFSKGSSLVEIAYP